MSSKIICFVITSNTLEYCYNVIFLFHFFLAIPVFIYLRIGRNEWKWIKSGEWQKSNGGSTEVTDTGLPLEGFVPGGHIPGVAQTLLRGWIPPRDLAPEPFHLKFSRKYWKALFCNHRKNLPQHSYEERRQISGQSIFIHLQLVFSYWKLHNIRIINWK